MQDKDVLKLPRGSDAQVGRYFKAKEFDCKCFSCDHTLVSLPLVQALDQIRAQIGARVVINSAYRCKYYQSVLRERGYKTAKGLSQHELGCAVDIRSNGMSGKDLEVFARMAGIQSIGIGPDFIHIDMRPEFKRWGYP